MTLPSSIADGSADDAQLVDEITHDTFVFAFRRIAEFTAGTSFRAWLRAIAANKIRAEIERYRREEGHRLAYAELRALEEALGEVKCPDSPELVQRGQS